MKKKILTVLLCCLPLMSFAETLWEPQPIRDEQQIAKVIFKQAKLLNAEQLAPAEFIPLLGNTQVIFTDVENIQVTARDIAYTILQVAKVNPPLEAPLPSKYIYYCISRNNEVIRKFIPIIPEDEFQRTIQALKE